MSLLWQKGLHTCDLIKDFEMGRLSWIIRCTQCNHKGAYKKEENWLEKEV